MICGAIAGGVAESGGVAGRFSERTPVVERATAGVCRGGVPNSGILFCAASAVGGSAPNRGTSGAASNVLVSSNTSTRSSAAAAATAARMVASPAQTAQSMAPRWIAPPYWCPFFSGWVPAKTDRPCCVVWEFVRSKLTPRYSRHFLEIVLAYDTDCVGQLQAPWQSESCCQIAT